MGTPGIILLVVFLAAALGIAAWLGYRFIGFQQTHEAAWRDHVLNAAAAFRERLTALEREVRDARRRRQDEVEKERLRAYQRYLGTISVDALQEYPNIGPVTVEKLRQAGMTTMDRVPQKLQASPGIGPKREKDLRAAITKVLRDAQSRFDSGGCREAQEWKERTRVVEAAIARQIADAEESARIAGHMLDHLQPYVAIARHVTFLGHLRGKPVAGLTPKLLDTPLEQLLPPAPAAPPPAPRPQPAPVPPPVVVPGTSAVTTTKEPPVLPPEPVKPLPSKPADLFKAMLETTGANAPPKTEHPRLPHLRAVIGFAFAVARADGRVAASERDAIRDHLQQSFGHEPELNRWIHPLLEQAEKNTPALDECLPALRALASAAELRGLYDFACAIADAAGKRNAKEAACLEKIAAAWELKPAAASRAPESPVTITAKPQAALGRDDALAALEIAPGTPLTGDLVRRQYRLLCERYDPAKFAGHGAEFVAVAQGKRDRVEQSAMLLVEQLGEVLDDPARPEPPQDMRHNPDLDAVFGM
jgi:tellurite resistance protein